MEKNNIPWIYSRTFDPHYPIEEDESEEPAAEEQDWSSDQDSDYPFNKETLF
ncbi:MAG: hypothetical protein ACOX1Y_14850 [Zhaonellaceae bacterium]